MTDILDKQLASTAVAVTDAPVADAVVAAPAQQAVPADRAGAVVAFLPLACALCAGLFAWLALAVRHGGTLAFDRPILLFLHRFASPLLDQAAVSISTAVTTVSVTILVYLLYRRHWRRALFWLSTAGGAAILCALMKKVVQRHRPALWDVAFPHASFSFPSGHATESMAVVATLFLLVPPALRAPLAVAAAVFLALVACSRVYLGLHYPSDVLAGWALAGAWVSAVSLAFPAARRPRTD